MAPERVAVPWPALIKLPFFTFVAPSCVVTFNISPLLVGERVRLALSPYVPPPNVLAPVTVMVVFSYESKVP